MRSSGVPGFLLLCGACNMAAAGYVDALLLWLVVGRSADLARRRTAGHCPCTVHGSDSSELLLEDALMVTDAGSGAAAVASCLACRGAPTAVGGALQLSPHTTIGSMTSLIFCRTCAATVTECYLVYTTSDRQRPHRCGVHNTISCHACMMTED
jgi:hypothetical protein